MRIITADDYLARALAPDAGTRDPKVEDRVRGILERVRKGGDEALRRITHELDRVQIDDFRVPQGALEEAWDAQPAALQRALRASAQALTRYQRSLKPRRVITQTSPGVQIVTEWVPLRRVGAYAPGGRAAYPSTVLMTTVPARVAGVDEVHLATPPGPDGRPSQVVLAAAHLAGVDAVWSVGGAQALAAFAYGTETVPRVDKVVGPGNVYVAEAKRQLQGTVGTDAIAGPSELAVWADPSVDPGLVAVDLAAQAEHDPQAQALVVTTNRAYARKLQRVIEATIRTAQRGGVLETSLGESGVIVVAQADQVPAVLDAAAPEHVELLGVGAAQIARQLRSAGTIFEGPLASASLGDYVTGADHVLPTNRTARWSSPLSVHDYLRQRVRQRVTRPGLARVGPHAVAIAEAEGLPNHAEAVRRRLPK